MSSSIFFNGKLIRVPGSYTEIDASGLEFVGLGATGVIGVIGESDDGEPGVIHEVAYPDRARRIFSGGDLVEGVTIFPGQGFEVEASAFEQVFRALKIDRALQGVGVEEPLARAGMHLDSGAFIGALVKWFFIIVFLVAAMDVLGLTQVNIFLSDVVLVYLPKVIVASIILVAAAVLAETMKRLVTGSARAAHLPSAGFLGGVSKWAIWVFAILAALFQLGIAGPLVQTILTGVIAAVSLAVGLSLTGREERDATASPDFSAGTLRRLSE